MNAEIVYMGYPVTFSVDTNTNQFFSLCAKVTGGGNLQVEGMKLQGV